MPSTPHWGDDLDDSSDDEQPQQTCGGLAVTKMRVAVEKVREPLIIGERRQWKKFGQAALDAESDTQSTVQSKEEIFLADPHADTDLQDEDPAAAIASNYKEFWDKQHRRKLERKYDVLSTADVVGDAPGGLGGLEDAAAGVGWTQVGAAGTTGKYAPPSARAGAMGTGVGFTPESRTDDLNTIRVTNLSESTTEADLQDLFQRFGRISRIYLAKDKETMQSRGFAFVSFVSKDDAAQAMEELQGFGYDHLILKLEWARPNAPKDPASSGTEFRSGYGKALAQDTKEKVSFLAPRKAY
jgi:translation initiation factor 3 subunit G